MEYGLDVNTWKTLAAGSSKEFLLKYSYHNKFFPIGDTISKFRIRKMDRYSSKSLFNRI